MNIDDGLHSQTFAVESYRDEAVDLTSEYQRWQMRIRQLLREADQAKAKGQWKKAQDLLFEVSKITRNIRYKET